MGTEGTLTELLKQCTVQIGTGAKRGTGFFVAPHALMTCAHVLPAAATTVEFRTHDGRGPFVAKVKQRHPSAAPQAPSEVSWPDLAMLTTDFVDHESVLLLPDVQIHDPLYGFGYTDQYPNGEPVTAEAEGVTAPPMLLKFKEGQVRPGLSGSPVLNLRTCGVCGIVKRSRQAESDLGGRGTLTTTILEYFPELVLEQAKFHRTSTVWTARMSRSSQGALLEGQTGKTGPHPVSSISLAIYQRLQDCVKAPGMYGAWIPCSPSSAFIRVLAADAQYLYAGMTNGQGLYRSGDGGKSWREATLGFPPFVSISALVVEPDSGRLIASGDDAIWVSADQGATWQRSYAEVTGKVLSIFVSSEEPELVAFGDHEGGGMSVTAGTVATATTSGGPSTVSRTHWGGGHLHVRRGDRPWTTYALKTINGMTGSTRDTRMVWIASADAGLYVTRDLFDSVQVVESASNLRPLRIALPSDDTVVAMATMKGLFLSYDDGQTWAQASEIGSVQVADVLFVDGHADHALAATEAGVYESVDACRTWKPSFEGLDCLWSMSLLQWGRDIFVGTSGGGVYVRGPRQRNWRMRESGFPAANAVGLAYANSALVACCLGVYRSMDDGASWKRIGLMPQQVWSLAVLAEGMATAPTVSAPGLLISRRGGPPIRGHGTVLRLLATTRDTVHLHDGTSWRPLKTFEKARSLRDLRVDDSSVIYVLAEGVGVFCSEDHGQQWLELSAVEHAATIAVLREAVLLATVEGTLFRTGDHGKTWNTISAISALAIAGAGESAYLVSPDGSIARSTDTGNTFSTVAKIELPQRRRWAKLVVSAFNHEHVWLATSGGAFRSTDGGRDWEAVPGGLLGEYHVNDLLVTEDTVYAAMTEGVFRLAAQ